jgi:hypothetical protein
MRSRPACRCVQRITVRLQPGRAGTRPRHACVTMATSSRPSTRARSSLRLIDAIPPTPGAPLRRRGAHPHPRGGDQRGGRQRRCADRAASGGTALPHGGASPQPPLRHRGRADTGPDGHSLSIANTEPDPRCHDGGGNGGRAHRVAPNIHATTADPAAAPPAFTERGDHAHGQPPRLAPHLRAGLQRVDPSRGVDRVQR